MRRLARGGANALRIWNERFDGDKIQSTICRATISGHNTIPRVACKTLTVSSLYRVIAFVGIRATHGPRVVRGAALAILPFTGDPLATSMIEFAFSIRPKVLVKMRGVLCCGSEILLRTNK